MKNLISVSLVLFTILSQAQTQLVPQWTKKKVSLTNHDAEAWGIDIGPNGNVYWTVNSSDSNAQLDIYCYKYDETGTELWSSPLIYGGSGTQQSYVLNAKDTFIYIGGRTCPGLVTTCNMLLLKIDKSNGNLLWDKELDFAANGYDEIDGLIIKDDGIYTGGWCQQYASRIYYGDIGLWTLNFDGSTKWTNHYGDTLTAEHQDGHFVVDDSVIYAAGLHGGKSIGNLYNGYAYIGKFDKTDGSFIDDVKFGAQSDSFLDIENALGMTSDGEFLYVTGYATPITKDDWQIFVAKYDKNLNEIWYTHWGGTESESARGIAVRNDTIYIAGLTESPSLMVGQQRDGMLLKFGTDGQFYSYHPWGDSLKNSFQDLAVQSGDIYLSGTSESAAPNPKKQGFVLKIDGVGVSVETLPFSHDITIYPNPAQSSTQLKFDKPGTFKTVSVYSANGQLVFSKTISNLQSYLTLDNLETGLYYVEAQAEDFSVAKKLIISD